MGSSPLTLLIMWNFSVGAHNSAVAHRCCRMNTGETHCWHTLKNTAAVFILKIQQERLLSLCWIFFFIWLASERLQQLTSLKKRHYERGATSQDQYLLLGYSNKIRILYPHPIVVIEMHVHLFTPMPSSKQWSGAGLDHVHWLRQIDHKCYLYCSTVHVRWYDDAHNNHADWS